MYAAKVGIISKKENQMAFISATRSHDDRAIYINVDNIIAAFPYEDGTSIQVTGQNNSGGLFTYFVHETYEQVKERINNALSSGL